MKSAAVYLANGFEEVEALMVVDLLRRAGIKTHMISITDKKDITGRTDITVSADLAAIFNDSYDAIILPGGMPGTLNLSENQALCNLILNYNKNAKLIAAICAAPTILGRLGILLGKKACCYPGYENQLTGATALQEKVYVDNNVITSRGIGTAIEFALAVITYLLDKETANKIAEEIVYDV